jgi:hypothetical protein
MYTRPPPTPAAAAGEKGKELVAEALEEHDVVKRLIEELQTVEPEGEQYDAKCKVLSENVEHHAQEEEDEMFPVAREVLGENIGRLGREMKQRKRTSRRRRHRVNQLLAVGTRRDQMKAFVFGTIVGGLAVWRWREDIARYLDQGREELSKPLIRLGSKPIRSSTWPSRPLIPRHERTPAHKAQAQQAVLRPLKGGWRRSGATGQAVTLDGGQSGPSPRTATTMYRDMDMTYWLEKAEAEAADLGR